MKKKSFRQGNKYADLAAPQRQLDFHQFGRLTPAQILREIESFLTSSTDENIKKVLIITGKGLHSKEGRSVIKPLIQKYLHTSDLVKNFSFAPMNQGGDGAFLVTLNTWRESEKYF